MQSEDVATAIRMMREEYEFLRGTHGQDTADAALSQLLRDLAEGENTYIGAYDYSPEDA